jgi:hypothetical protein
MRQRYSTYWSMANALIAITLLAGLALGQANARDPFAPATNPAGQPAAVPAQRTETKAGAQIEKLLRAFEGTWTIHEKLTPDSTLPNGATGVGQIVWRSGPGGFSVIEDYQSKQGARQVSGLGVFWWDDAAGGYRTIWCDSTNPGGCISFKNPVRWDGEQLVLVEDYEVNGKKFTFKEVFGDISRGAFTQTLYGGEAGGSLKVDQTIHAVKTMPESR